MASFDSCRELAEGIMQRRRFIPLIAKPLYSPTEVSHISWPIFPHFAALLMAGDRISDAQVPPKIQDALEDIKEQMLVRDIHKPEYLIWELRLAEDELTFGFLNQTQKNQLTKQRMDISFITASEHFLAYFKTKQSVPYTDISGFSKKRDDAIQ